MKEIKAINKVNNNISRKVKLIAPFILMTGGMIWINQDTVKADTTPQADTVKDTDDNIATSKEYGKIGGEHGSDWVVDSEGVLRIQEGTWDDSEVENFWLDMKKSDGSSADLKFLITSVVFEGKVIAGESLDGLFSGQQEITSVTFSEDGELDTSKTKNFDKIFLSTKIKNFDMNELNWENVESAVSMFESSGLTEISMKGIKAHNLNDISSMFYQCANLKSANFDDVVLDESVDAYSFLSGCENLGNVSFNGSSIWKLNKTSEMFSNDHDLENLDVSSLDWSDATDISGMFSFYIQKTKFQSITLPANANLKQTGIDGYDEKYFKGWKNKDTGETTESLIDYYNDNDVDKATWILEEADKLNYTVKYIDEDGNLVKEVAGSGISGDPITFTNILGYVYSENNDFNELIINKDNQEFIVNVKEKNPYTVTVKVKYNDGHADETFDVEIPFGVSDAASQIDQTELDKYSNNNTLDNENSKVFFNRLASGDPGFPDNGYKLTDFIEDFQGNDLKSYFNTFMDWLNNNTHGSSDLQSISGKTFDLFEVTFAHYVKPEDNNTNNNHNNNTSTDKKITTIDQKAATFNKTTALYDNDGKQISDVKLSPNSDWKNDQQMILNGTTYYRVSINTWVKASDVYVYTDLDSKIRVHADKRSRIKRATGELTDRALEKSTEWKTDRYTMINDQKYYRVSTNGFVNANEVDEYFD